MAHGKLAILRRRLFNVFAAVLLIACFGAAYIATLNSAYFDETPYAFAYPGWYVQCAHQKLELIRVQVLEPLPKDFQPTPFGFRWVGYRQSGYGNIFPGHPRRGAVNERWYVSVWLLILLTAVLPAVSGVRWLYRYLRRRHATGLCPVCGYDLRATPDRCPECGTPIPLQSSPINQPSI